ncbi:aldehyde oxidase GLOX1-like [Typha angustifolia]|uniref:aldehyde oxidase GLOX1-like n=1 Tax=Typha angustifolia TaxID=59011 RepID=UPI003C2C9BF8
METLLKAASFLLPLLLAATLAEPFPFDNFFNIFPPAGSNPDSFLVPSNIPKAVNQPPTTAAASDFTGGFAGKWELITNTSGVSAMHLAILKDNKAIMFDTTSLGPSTIKLPNGNCRIDQRSKNKSLDCWAHAVEFDYNTGKYRALKVLTDTWCSSGGFALDGTLVQTGGYAEGDRAVRYISPCPTCNWVEYQYSLGNSRWYATQQILPDGSFIVIGGRRGFNYEFVPQAGQKNAEAIPLQFLIDTTDDVENNLYPFVHLAPDGTLFVFANDRAIILDPRTHIVVRQLPRLDGGSRNYPASGMSALLPLDLRQGIPTDAEVIVCGGATKNSFTAAGKNQFLPALTSCGRINITTPNANWRVEEMPVARTMGDMLILPSAEILMINGASKGCAGWYFGRDPVFTPVLYHPNAAPADRFRMLAPTTIARMYHSSSAVLPDATVLVAGSNPNNAYHFTKVDFQTEVRVERFYPPYLDPALAKNRAEIDEEAAANTGMRYLGSFTLNFKVEAAVEEEDVMVTMYAPPFTTHGFSMNQRLLILKTEMFTEDGSGGYTVTVAAPPKPELAPPGYYLVFVVTKGVPSKGIWVQIQ